MAVKLSHVRIEKLHGWKSVQIPLEDNRLILVGENGSGKTTIINLLYFFLSRQWDRLASFDLQSISVVINGEEIAVTKDQLRSRRALSTVSQFRRRFGVHMTPREVSRLRRLTESVKYKDLPNDRILLEFLSRDYGLAPERLHRFFEDSAESDKADLGLGAISERIAELVQEQILYLPTYRRIEQDLKTIFPRIEIDHKLLHDRLPTRQDGRNFIELVEFGMEDVDKNIETKMIELKEDTRSRLSKLTGSYLREVISGEYKSFRIEDVGHLREEAIESIFNRIGEDILPQDEKNRMRAVLREIQSKQELNNDQRVIAHFLLKLLEVYEAQKLNEENIRRFVDVCNQYLTATKKQIVFDNSNFNISIVLTDEEDTINRDQERYTIKMKQLSSGEKQIVSLFSHLFLSGIDEFFVLIDEPELSLSVLWQKKFLSDIFGIEHCTGLVAVTHSPFIFDNELDSFAHSLNEFWY